MGLRQGEIFWLRLTTASAQCLRLSERFFHLVEIIVLFPSLNSTYNNALFSLRLTGHFH